MALVKIANEDRSIDFNDLEYLNHTDGWNGGQWNNLDVVKDPNSYEVFAINGSSIFRVEPISVDTYGVDNDMGKHYDWSSKRLMILLKTDLGCIFVNSLELPKHIKFMYRKKLIDLDKILG